MPHSWKSPLFSTLQTTCKHCNFTSNSSVIMRRSVENYRDFHKWGIRPVRWFTGPIRAVYISGPHHEEELEFSKLVVFASDESMFVGLPGPPELSIYLDHITRRSVENYGDFHVWGISPVRWITRPTRAVYISRPHHEKVLKFCKLVGFASEEA